MNFYKFEYIYISFKELKKKNEFFGVITFIIWIDIV